MNKGLTWITLRKGLEEPGCPICNIIADGTRRSFCYFLGEGVLDPERRMRLMESNGWCTYHAQVLLTVEHRERPDHLGSATVYESLLEAARRRLEEARQRLARPASGRSRRRVLLGAARALAPTRPCPVCESEEEREDAEAGFLVEALFDPDLGQELKELYERSEGLCCRHLIACLRRCAGPQQAAALLDLERPKLAALVEAVAEYARKHEHRYHHEPFGDEVDAWARAARKLAGHRPPGTSLERLIALTRRREGR